MTSEERARQDRAAKRAKLMVLHKTQLGQREVDFTPVKGAAAISLATRLTVESFSLARGSRPGIRANASRCASYREPAHD